MAEIIVCAIFVAFFSVMLVAGYLTTTVFLGDESVRIYPSILLLGIILCLVFHCINRWKELPESEKKRSLADLFRLKDKNTWRLIITIAITIAYFLLLDKLSFIFLTPLIGMYYIIALGEKKWWKAFIISLVITAVVYCIFIYGLRVRLPRGVGVIREIAMKIEFLFG